ncbi:YihY/virulence factor BrkB family protein [Odoribacter lunatus]|uniref:YihY/virulence factor BrkB family protein n=1 Tax=Odoribacter lunatus TaxID=2941335 RepID=UPI00203DACB8|nr:YihY/virulence factor BrkB family protein [Odoribacter lunatus]
MFKLTRFKKIISLDYYYAILRKDWHKSSLAPGLLLRGVAMLVISIDRFIKDACMVSASALTFYSVLSFIPIVALALGIAKGFGLGKVLEQQMLEQTFTDSQIMAFVVQFANHALENTKGGLITGLGIVILLWSVIKVLGSTELAMNRIWGIKKGRKLTRKFSDYLSVMFIVPILLILISGVNVFLTSNLQTIAVEEGFLRYASSVIISLVNLIPYFLVWFLFIFLYMYMPATPVKFKHAVVSGIIAGTVYQVVQWFYIRFQIGVSSYNAIYGSLAALPLLLVWLQLSWSIVLWGTELCYIIRNRHFMYRNSMERGNYWVENVDQAVRILKYVACEYLQNNGALTLGKLSRRLKISASKLQVVIQELVDDAILAEVKQEDDMAYLPAVDLYQFSMADVISRLANIEQKDKGWEKRFLKAVEQEFGSDKFAPIAQMDME